MRSNEPIDANQEIKKEEISENKEEEEELDDYEPVPPEVAWRRWKIVIFLFIGSLALAVIRNIIQVSHVPHKYTTEGSHEITQVIERLIQSIHYKRDQESIFTDISTFIELYNGKFDKNIINQFAINQSLDKYLFSAAKSHLCSDRRSNIVTYYSLSLLSEIYKTGIHDTKIPSFNDFIYILSKCQNRLTVLETTLEIFKDFINLNHHKDIKGHINKLTELLDGEVFGAKEQILIQFFNYFLNRINGIDANDSKEICVVLKRGIDSGKVLKSHIASNMCSLLKLLKCENIHIDNANDFLSQPACSED